MKRVLASLICLGLVCLFMGCAGTSGTDVPGENAGGIVGALKVQQLTIADLDALLAQQEMCVTHTEYTVQDARYKSLYPDMLKAVIANNSAHDVKNAVVAFVAWDENGLPIKIKGNIDFSDGSYVKLVNYGDINLIPGGEFGRNSGYEVDENNGIKTFKAAVVSYETFDGESWDNPYYDEWKKMYEGVKYGDDLTIETR